VADPKDNAERTTVIAAAALGLVWLGDALIYVVLPLYPAAFGVDLALVGVLLAVNRIVRILGYGWVAPLARRFGAHALVAGTCAVAAVSTLLYGLATGFVILLVARIAWGASYGVLYLTGLAYSYGDGQGAGRRMGLYRAVSTLGPVAALAAGGWLVTVTGPQQAFVIYGLIGLLAVPLALRLPALRHAAEDKIQAPNRWIPNPLNILFFMIALGADGVFTATLSILLAEIVSVSSALIGAGLLLAFHRAVVVVLALASGPLVDRLEAGRLLAPASLAAAAGLGLIAAGFIYAGALVLIGARAVLGILGPIVAAQRAPSDRINAMASYATWSDTGLALGPLVGTMAVAWIGFSLTYAVLAGALVAALAWVAVIAKPWVRPPT
jgi:predicted MFS family arabinose efflux permease